MNPKPNFTADDLAAHFGLRVEYRDDLPATNAGFLDSEDEPTYIAVNQNLPRCEQHFTVGHEICHLLKHHNVSRRKYPVRWVNREYTSPKARLYTRYFRYVLHKCLSIELEADLFALSLCFELGAMEDLKDYLDLHPEKVWWALYVAATRMVRLPFRYVIENV